MDIIQCLTKNKIPFQEVNGKIVIQCPYCDKSHITGIPVANFHINPEGGKGQCYDCHKIAEFNEVLQLLGISAPIAPSATENPAVARNSPNSADRAEDEPPIKPENYPPIDVSQFKPMSAERLVEILGLTIKRDEENKLIAFLGELSAYTEESQLNISFNAPSSTGKSYIPTEIAQLFPQEDVIELGYCSPTAFFHDKSKEYKKETNELIVDLSRKILIFLDQPHTLLLQHLRPLLSHDKKEIKLKITDKAQRGGLRTKNVFLRGFPAVIFCTAGLKADEQETTRFILLSPQTDREKIRAAIYERIKKESDSKTYRLTLEDEPERKLLKERIRAIKQEHVSDIKIGSPQKVEEAFFAKNTALKPRHQRDIGRIMSLIKAFALLNLWFREKDGSTIVANEDDIREAFKVWDAISESQEFNLPPYVYQLFKEVIMPTWTEKSRSASDELNTPSPLGLTRREITQKHYQVYGRVLADWLLRQQIIPMLENAGLISQERDLSGDKRNMLVCPTAPLTVSAPQNNSELGGGVNDQEIVSGMVGRKKDSFGDVPPSLD